MKALINQPFGVGDILFLSPLVKHIDAEEIIWPIVDHYYWIKDYIKIPNVQFIKQSDFINNNYSGYSVVPFQYAQSLIPHSDDCMQAKYMLLDADLEIWRTLTFDRNLEKEEQLKKHLGINKEDQFIFVNNNFAGPEYNYSLDIKLQTDLKIIYQSYIDGYTLLDWCGVLEQAQEIHTVSTALFFVIEGLKIQNKPLHLYTRKPLDRDLSPIKTLINNKWIKHE